MEITQKKARSRGIKFFIMYDNIEIGRAFLYLMYNDLHKEPFGLLEDVFVDKSYRSQGTGTELVNQIIKEAKKQKCYKLIATSRYSRPKVHALYKRLGFEDRGKEFRLNLKN